MSDPRAEDRQSDSRRPVDGQPFDVHMHNCSTGERWSVRVDAVDPAGALSKVLRRRRWSEALLSEQRHKFLVEDVRDV